jgi:hypothetical protein
MQVVGPVEKGPWEHGRKAGSFKWFVGNVFGVEFSRFSS